MRRGVISRVNGAARELGVAVGDACRDAALHLRNASAESREPAPFGETRSEMRTDGGRRVVLLDSASVVRPEDVGAIVVTGSHGGLVGGAIDAALRVDAFAAVFNDAGIGMEEAGVARIAPLDARGIAAFTVAAHSARIGEAQSTYADGTVSRANATARRLGVREGEPARLAINRLARL
jgi:nucleotidyltransferase/DNA polymerase involved in DNA repair